MKGRWRLVFQEEAHGPEPGPRLQAAAAQGGARQNPCVDNNPSCELCAQRHMGSSAIHCVAPMLPKKMPGAPKIIFGLACIATVGTASYAVMSRSIDKDWVSDSSGKPAVSPGLPVAHACCSTGADVQGCKVRRRADEAKVQGPALKFARSEGIPKRVDSNASQGRRRRGGADAEGHSSRFFPYFLLCGPCMSGP